MVLHTKVDSTWQAGEYRLRSQEDETKEKLIRSIDEAFEFKGFNEETDDFPMELEVQLNNAIVPSNRMHSIFLHLFSPQDKKVGEPLIVNFKVLDEITPEQIIEAVNEFYEKQSIAEFFTFDEIYDLFLSTAAMNYKVKLCMKYGDKNKKPERETKNLREIINEETAKIQQTHTMLKKNSSSKCRYGKACKNAHGLEELRTKTEPITLEQLTTAVSIMLRMYQKQRLQKQSKMNRKYSNENDHKQQKGKLTGRF